MDVKKRALDASAAHVPKTSSAIVAGDERVFVGVVCVPVLGGVIPLYIQTVYTRRSGILVSGASRREVMAVSDDNLQRTGLR